MWFWNILGWILGLLIIIPICICIIAWVCVGFKIVGDIILVMLPFISIAVGIICIIYAFIVEEYRARGLLIRGGIICCLVIPDGILKLSGEKDKKKKGAN